MRDAVVKISNNEVVKISACKDVNIEEENGTLIVENHLGEKYMFSPHNYLYIKLMPVDEELK